MIWHLERICRYSDDTFQGMRRKRIVLKCVVASELKVHMSMMYLPALGCYISAHNAPASNIDLMNLGGTFNASFWTPKNHHGKRKKESGSCIHG
jgi:hypothetical protein